MRFLRRASAVLLVATFLAEPWLSFAPAARSAAATPTAEIGDEVFVARIERHARTRRQNVREKQRDELIACIAKRPATARQRRIALRRARLAYQRMSAARRAAARRRSRYLAIQTERDARAKGVITCMVFDTRTMQIVGENVYDCESVPPLGAGLKFESFITTYVGS